MIKNIFYFLFLIFTFSSCRFKGTKHISEAYSYCNGVDGEKYYYKVDSLHVILSKAKGKLRYFNFIKGSHTIFVVNEAGNTRELQLSNRGNYLHFHYLNGKGRNIWYTVKDSVLVKQYYALDKRNKQSCKN